MSARRTAAIGALLLGFGGFGLAVIVAVQEFPRGLIALACVALATAAAWYGVLRRGPRRIAGLSVGALGLGVAIVLLARDRLLEELLVVAALVLSCACARAAFGVRAHLSRVPAPRRPVLFFNPKSGGGKAERFSLAAQTAPRPSSPRSPLSSTSPTPACRRERATTSRLTWASIATTSSARSMRSSTAASAPNTSVIRSIWRRTLRPAHQARARLPHRRTGPACLSSSGAPPESSDSSARTAFALFASRFHAVRTSGGGAPRLEVGLFGRRCW
jgi:hypothetical protein